MTDSPLVDAKRKRRIQLAYVAYNATEAEEARRHLEIAIRNAARHHGANARELATASGLSRRVIRRIVNSRRRRLIVRPVHWRGRT